MVSSRSRCAVALLIVVLCPAQVSRAQDAYGKGWALPIDGVDLDAISDNFGLGYPAYPYEGVWHCGFDIPGSGPPTPSAVRAVAGGKVELYSPGGWDYGGASGSNYAIVVRTATVDGKTAHIGYGHLGRPKDADGRPLTDDRVRSLPLREVKAGEVLGELGDFRSAPHLHLFIYFDPAAPSHLPSRGYGKQALPRPKEVSTDGVRSYGGWWDPIGWMRTYAPASGLAPPTPAPILVLDRSGSMSGVQDELNRHAEQCVDGLLARTSRMAVVNFQGADSATVDAPLCGDRSRILKAIREPSLRGGGTALYDAVIEAVKEARRADESALLIAMTDGEDNSSRASLGQAIQWASTYGVRCCVISFAGGSDPYGLTGSDHIRSLRDLCTRTRGVYITAREFTPSMLLDKVETFQRVEIKASPVKRNPPAF